MKIIVRYFQMEETMQCFLVAFLLYKSQSYFLNHTHIVRMPFFQFHQTFQALCAFTLLESTESSHVVAYALA